MRKYMKMLACLMAAIYMVSCQKDPIFEEVSSLTTLDATDVSINSAVLNGELDLTYWRRDNIQVEYVGFYISTSSDFNSEDTEYYEQYSSSSSSPHLSFSQEARGLKENTTYYYYAYARKWADEAVIKGAVKSFTTSPIIVPQGAIRGLFSVSSTKKVFFSKGNLQYKASTATWRFAENQYDYVGDGNLNVSATYSGWIDLFGQGTSGYNGRYPYNTWDDDTESYGNPNGDLDGTNYDWGVYNAISNGGNQKGMWRTMSSAECNYLFQKRANASQLYSNARIAGTNGMIVLPDNWILPSGCSFNPGQKNYSSNVYTLEKWAKMEQAGAVFLPAAGGRCFRFNSPYSGFNDIEMRDVNVEGSYRLSTSYWFENKPSFAYIYDFDESSILITGYNYGGLEWAWSVRLVRDFQ